VKIFIDSADLGEIREAAEMGAIDGVTTNPSLLAKAGAPLEKTIRAICEIVDGPISAEVISTTAAEIRGWPESRPRVHRKWHQDERHLVLLC
jgi:transaldolase